MKGGAIILPDIFNIYGLMFKYKEFIKIEPFGGSSVGGYLYKLKFEEQQPTRDEIMSINPGEKDEQNIVSSVSEIIVKVTQIGYKKELNKNELKKDIKKFIITPKLFNNELEIQRDIYNKSMDTFCEPICPNIISGEIIYKNDFDKENPFTILDYIYKAQNGGHSIAPFTQKTNNTENTVLRIGHYVDYSSDYDHGVGLIFMESKTNCQTVGSLWGDNQTKNMVGYYVNKITTEIQQIVLDNFVFQLIRLQKLGYSHGDPHLHNALFIQNYNYIDDYRVYLIDFGETRIRPDAEPNYAYHLPFYMFHIPQDSEDHWSYQIVKYLYKYIYLYGRNENMKFTTNDVIDINNRINDTYHVNIKNLDDKIQLEKMVWNSWIQKREIWYANKLKKTDISKKIFIKNLYKKNLLDIFNDLKKKNTHSQIISHTRLDDSRLIFLKEGLLPYIIGGITENSIFYVKLHIDGEIVIKEQQTSIVNGQYVVNEAERLYINPEFADYKMDLVRVVFEYERIREYGSKFFYKNDEIKDNVHVVGESETAFKWIIGMANDEIANIYFMEIKSGWELANYHGLLCSNYKLQKFYMAGEMKGNKKDDSLTFNLHSDFFRDETDERGNYLRENIDKYINILIPFVANKTKYKEEQIILDTKIRDLNISLFDKNYWLEEERKQRQVEYLNELTYYVKNNYNKQLFQQYTQTYYNNNFLNQLFGGNGTKTNNDKINSQLQIMEPDKSDPDITQELNKNDVKNKIMMLQELIRRIPASLDGENNNSVKKKDEKKLNLNNYNDTVFGEKIGEKFGEVPKKSSINGGKKGTKKTIKKSKKKSKKNLIGKQDFGSWKNGSSVFKDKKGFYVVQWNPKKNEEYKKYLKKWKPKNTKKKLMLKNNKWIIRKSKKKSNK